jgi:cytochrome c2
MINKKTATMAVLAGIVVLLSAFMPKQQDTFKAKNLKVLPKNISKEDLDKIMDGFKVSLGVRCNYCHASMKDNPKKMDFASDDNAKKDIARDMMRMTAKINKKYFQHEMKDGKGQTEISCTTCHNGKSEPVLKSDDVHK